MRGSDQRTGELFSYVDFEARVRGDQPSRLCYFGHALMENRHGLVVGALLTRATGTAEREAALLLIDRHRPSGRRAMLGADKAYDAAIVISTRSTV